MCFAQFVEMQLPPVLAGLVLAAALAAVVSTSSGALIAPATVFSQDVVARLLKRDVEAGQRTHHLRNNRFYLAGFGVAMVVIACVLQDVVAALTVAYTTWLGDCWRQFWAAWCGGAAPSRCRRGDGRRNRCHAATMVVHNGGRRRYLRHEPIYFGLASGPVVFVVGSLLSPPTAPDVLAEWDRRSRGEQTAPVTTPSS